MNNYTTHHHGDDTVGINGDVQSSPGTGLRGKLRRSTSVSVPYGHVTSVADGRGPLLTRHLSTTPADNINITTESLGLKPYKRRFYIILIFGYQLFMNGFIWGTWMPIAHSTEDVFNMSDGEFALLSNWGAIGAIITLIPVSVFLHRGGLRKSMLLMTSLTVLSAGVRLLIVIDVSYGRWALHLGQLFNGFTTGFGQIAAPVVSAAWFPYSQRSTATGMSAMTNPLGVAISALIGPLIVQEFNISHAKNWSRDDNVTRHELDIEYQNMKLLLYIHMATAVLLLLLTVIYFPMKPPTPPSLSASREELSISSSLKIILRNRNYWLFSFGALLPVGVFIGWTAMLDIILKELGVRQTDVGFLQFLNIMIGNVACILGGWLSDRFKGHIKSMVLCCTIFGLLMAVWFTLQYEMIIPNTKATIYTSIILLGVANLSFFALTLEGICEISHPVSGSIAMVAPQFIMNITMAIFLLVPFIPNIGVRWMNWSLVGVCCVSPILIAMVKIDYCRLKLDASLLDNEESNDRQPLMDNIY